MYTRIRPRNEVKHIFENFLVFVQSSQSNPGNSIRLIYSFPPVQQDNPLVRTISQFAFPCNGKITTIEHFVFVITTGDGRWQFGYCRQEPFPAHSADSQKSSVFLSELGYWNGVFFKVLNYLTSVSKWANATGTFLAGVYNTRISSLPNQGIDVRMQGFAPFQCVFPADGIELPSTLENRCLCEFYNAFTTETMLILFASLLAERNIIITSKRLSTLTSVVLACNIILHPLCWQHIFIPALPPSLTDYLEAPVPFIIGVPTSTWQSQTNAQKRQSLQSKCVQLDTDANTVTTPYPEDLRNVPKDILHFLGKNLRGRNPDFIMMENGLANSFMQAFVKLFGHYESALIFGGEKGGKLDEELFINRARPSHQKYLRNVLTQSQMFHQFVQERVARGQFSNETDIFHREIRAAKAVNISRPNDLPDLLGTSDPIRESSPRPMSTSFTELNLVPLMKNSSPVLHPSIVPLDRPTPMPRFVETALVDGGRQEIPTARPRPRPRAGAQAQPIQTPSTRVPRPTTLISNFNNVLSDLRARPAHQLLRSNSAKATSLVLMEPHAQIISNPPPLPPKSILKPNPPKPPPLSSKPKFQAQAPGQTKSDQNLIDLDSPVNNNNNILSSRAFWADRDRATGYPKGLIKPYALYAKDSTSSDFDLSF